MPNEAEWLTYLGKDSRRIPRPCSCLQLPSTIESTPSRQLDQREAGICVCKSCRDRENLERIKKRSACRQ